jgi:hypothetical protein
MGGCSESRGAVRGPAIVVPHVAPAHATEWLADANRIRAVLDC